MGTSWKEWLGQLNQLGIQGLWELIQHFVGQSVKAVVRAMTL